MPWDGLSSTRNDGVKIDFSTTGLEVVSSYVEDDTELNVLVSTKVSHDEKIGELEPRWTIRQTSNHAISS